MNILDLDVGNTRVKWRLSGGLCLEGVGPRSAALAFADLPPGAGIERLRVSSVAGSDWDTQLSQAASVRFGVEPQFAAPCAKQAGVTCGYDVPQRLGVDRWLAVLAAWHECQADAVVVDCGTATTLDFVRRDGRHLGGYIVPGAPSMVDSLFRGTAEVRAAGDLRSDVLAPGVSTDQAVARGVVRMICDFVEQAVARFGEQCEDQIHVFVCGGDADIITPHIRVPLVAVPGLVLDGLAIALP